MAAATLSVAVLKYRIINYIIQYTNIENEDRSPLHSLSIKYSEKYLNLCISRGLSLDIMVFSFIQLSQHYFLL